MIAYTEMKQKMQLNLVQLSMRIHWACNAHWERLPMVLVCRAIRLDDIFVASTMRKSLALRSSMHNI